MIINIDLPVGRRKIANLLLPAQTIADRAAVPGVLNKYYLRAHVTLESLQEIDPVYHRILAVAIDDPDIRMVTTENLVEYLRRAGLGGLVFSP